MRSVYLYLRETNESDVKDFVRGTYPFQEGPPWIADVSGDPCLYIHVNSLSEEGFKNLGIVEEWVELVTRFGGEPSVYVSADVSGRHPGDEQVRRFVTLLLTRFTGLARDDYTGHLWSLKQIRSSHRVHGLTFFDYRGWHEVLKPLA